MFFLTTPSLSRDRQARFSRKPSSCRRRNPTVIYVIWNFTARKPFSRSKIKPGPPLPICHIAIIRKARRARKENSITGPGSAVIAPYRSRILCSRVGLAAVCGCCTGATGGQYKKSIFLTVCCVREQSRPPSSILVDFLEIDERN